MFNPLCPFTEKLLDAFIRADKKYFVRQTYVRGAGGKESKGSFLISHYSEHGGAHEHFEAIASDRNRYLYDWENPGDRKRLLVAASRPAGYKIFAALVMPDWKTRAERALKQQVRKYTSQKIKWHPAKTDVVMFDLYPHFGEVFVKIRFRSQEIKVSLLEVESYSTNY